MPRSPNLVWHSTAILEEMLRPQGLVGSKELFRKNLGKFGNSHPWRFI